MLAGIEDVLLEQRPDWLLVYGDTNSTLAGALAACKLEIRIAHVEAGLRSFNRTMPEEHNRVLTDHCADLLFCPTSTAVSHLAREGITRGVHLVGDTMYDAVLQFAERAEQRSTVLNGLKLKRGDFALATVHRPYNTDDPVRLERLLRAFVDLPCPVVFPVHPRTRARIAELGALSRLDRLLLVEPVSYLDMLVLEKNARIVLTDSGGVQKEAFFFGVPCLTLRPETEWVETVAAGMNIVVDTDAERIGHLVRDHVWPTGARIPGLEPGAAERIVGHLEQALALTADTCA
jgi:UDP-N-acetylglucosamine 2-epimerase